MAKIDYTNSNAVLSTLLVGNDYDAGKIKSSISTIAASGKKMDARIHATAVALVDRSVAHRDCSLVPAIVEAMPKSARRNALVTWFHSYSNVRIREEKGGKITVGMLKPDAKGYNADASASTADANPFWNKPSVEGVPIIKAFTNETFLRQINSILKAAEAAGDKVTLDADNMAMLHALKVRANVAANAVAKAA